MFDQTVIDIVSSQIFSVFVNSSSIQLDVPPTFFLQSRHGILYTQALNLYIEDCVYFLNKINHINIENKSLGSFDMN